MKDTSPPRARAPGRRPGVIPKKQRGGRGGPASFSSGTAARGCQAPLESSVLGPIADAVAAHHQKSDRNAKEVQRVAREAAVSLRAAQDLLQAPVTGITPFPSPPPGPHQPPPRR